MNANLLIPEQATKPHAKPRRFGLQKYFWRRRIRNTSILLAVLALIGLYTWNQYTRLEPTSFATGYILFAAVFFLALYNVRKKLTVIPLGNSATWLQAHIYVAIGSIAVFFMHIGIRIPDGFLEGSLAAFFLVTAVSGIHGLYLTRTIPNRLRQLHEEVVFERIPTLWRQVANEAERVAFSDLEDAKATAIAEFYTDRLHRYFQSRRGLLYNFFPSGRQRRSICQELQNIRQYCDQNERTLIDRLFHLIRKKDDLDYQFALQAKLKYWLFGHVALTYGLIVLSLLHAVLAHAFYGGL